VQLVAGVSRQIPGQVNFDAEISPDGETLYFVDSQFGATGPETADIVIAVRNQQQFQRLSNSATLLQQVNTAALEYAPAISADGLTLFFTRLDQSQNPPQPAIYRTTRSRADLPFDPPQRLPLTGFVEAATFSPDERSIYFHKREGAKFVLMQLKL
jgi:Tol biopolymer transport system component